MSTSLVEARGALTSKGRMAVTAGVMTGLFLAAIDQTVVATAMPTVVASLGGLDIYSWVFSAYLLAFTVTIPVWGRLSDMRGRRPCYLASIALFLLGSMLAGQSRSMAFLIFSRVVQGLGAGGLFPIGFTIVGEIYSLEERARIQGLFSSVWGFASVVGPLVGGLLTDHLSWRWVFYVNLPFGVVSTLLIHLHLREPASKGERASIDYAGVLTLAGSITSLLLALIQGGKRGSFGDFDILLLFFIAAVLVAAFSRIERRAKDPLVPPSFFKNRVFLVGSGIGFLTGMGLFGTISFIPLFVQGVLFGSATRAGSTLTPFMLAWVALSIASGRLSLSWGYRPVVVSGTSLFAGGFVWLLQMGPESTYPSLLPAMAMMGAGMGLVAVAVLLSVQNAVPRGLLGAATATNLFFRSIGGTVGVAVMGSVMAHEMTGHLVGITNQNLVYLGSHPDAIVNAATRQALSPEAQQWLRLALADSLHAVFFCGLAIAAVALVLSLAFPAGSAGELAVPPDAIE